MANQQERGRKAMDLHVKLCENEHLRRQILWENVAILTEIEEQNYHREYLGDESAPFSAYLGEIEVFYSRNRVYELSKIKKKFVDELELTLIDIADIPHSRLFALCSIVNKENVTELLSQARALLRKDFDVVVRKAKGLRCEDDECSHNYQHLKRCKICGHRENLQ